MTQSKNIYKLPESWSWVKLSDISFPIEKAVVRYMNPNDQFRYIDIESIDNNSQNIENAKYHTWKTAPSRAQQIIQTNDILFATVRPYLKNIAVVTSEYNRQIASSGFCVIRPTLVNYKYVFYFVQSEAFVKSINKLAKGTSYPAVTNRIVLAQQIPLPPLNEQLRIVSKIEELLSGLAKSKEQLELAFRQIQFYKQSILKEIFEQSNCPKRKLEDLLLFIGSGSTPKGGKQVYSDTGIMFLRSQNIYKNKLELSNVVHITMDMHEKMKRSQVKPFDVLLNITGASIGRCTYFPDNNKEANVNQHVCILRPDSDKVFYKYLSIYLNSPEAQSTIMRVQTGATRQGLNYSQIKDIDVPLPETSVQKEIVRNIEEKNTICDKAQESIKDGLQQIETFKQTILQEAFQGMLVEPNINDEPVIALLENIQVEKKTYDLSEKEKLNTKIKPMADKAKSIIDILKGSVVSLPAKEVWLSSDKKDDIDDFYAELKKFVESGDIVELPRNGKDSFLKLAEKL